MKPYLAEHYISHLTVIGDADSRKVLSGTRLHRELLIDRNGKVSEAHAVMVEKAAVEKDIRKLLDEKAAGNPRSDRGAECT